MTSLVLELSAFFAVSFFVVAKCNYCPTIKWKGVHPNTLVKNVKNETRVFATISGVDLKGCIDNCQRRRVCQYINYYTAAHLCFLVEKLNGTMTEDNKVNDDKHFVFGNKSEWAQENWGQKYSVCNKCPERQLCTIEDGGGATCTIKECPAPPVVDDAEMLGNQYSIGSRLLYLCNTTKKSHGIVCQPNGTWSTIDLTYCQESTDTDEQTTTSTTPTTKEKTTTSTQPTATEKTTTSTQPTSTEKTTTSTQPTATEKTTTSTQPTATVKTTTSTSPTTKEQVTTSTSPTTKEQVTTSTSPTTTGPATTSTSTTTTEPATTSTSPTTTEPATTSTSPTTTEQVSCIIESLNLQRLNTILDDTQCQFVIISEKVTKGQALQYCVEADSKLVQILKDDNAKMKFLQDSLQTEGEDLDYWVDAQRVNKYGPWQTKDGQAVLDNASYWKPDSKNTDHTCAQLRKEKREYMYKLNDCKCNRDSAFICER